MSYEVNSKVRCLATGRVGTVLEVTWENGWIYTLLADDGKYFYRDHSDLKILNITKEEYYDKSSGKHDSTVRGDNDFI